MCYDLVLNDYLMNVLCFYVNNFLQPFSSIVRGTKFNKSKDFNTMFGWQGTFNCFEKVRK